MYAKYALISMAENYVYILDKWKKKMPMSHIRPRVSLTLTYLVITKNCHTST